MPSAAASSCQVQRYINATRVFTQSLAPPHNQGSILATAPSHDEALQNIRYADPTGVISSSSSASDGFTARFGVFCWTARFFFREER